MSMKLCRKRYFEGWYFKHQFGNQIIAFIPGINVGADGKKKAFIQIISNENSYSVDFPYDSCKINRKKCYIKIGANVFSKKGIKINLHTPDIQVTGRIKYSKLEPIKYSIMGCFRYIPYMECKHEVISMKHSLKGSLDIFEKTLKLTGGRGYIEKDWGHSFPSQYMWIQCNRFIKQEASIMLSIAKIPFMGFGFLGCICVIHYKGIEYRFTTYLGVKVITASETEIYLVQGKYKLIIFLEQENMKKDSDVLSQGKRKFGYQLNAPVGGEMSRPIREEHLCKARFILLKDHKKIIDLKSKDTSMEYVE